MAQIEALRSRAVQEFAKALPPEKRKQMADNLPDVLSKPTAARVRSVLLDVPDR